MTHPLREPRSSQSDSYTDFSLMEGGPLHRLQSIVGLTRTAAGFVYLAVAFALLTWLPLLALAAVEYGYLAASYTRAFEAKWLRSNGRSTEPLLGTPDVQSLADLANAFGVIRQMRIIPMTRSQILLLAGAAAVPALPLIFFIIPLNELIIRGVRTLLHL
jgi:hypothetical protein